MLNNELYEKCYAILCLYTVRWSKINEMVDSNSQCFACDINHRIVPLTKTRRAEIMFIFATRVH